MTIILCDVEDCKNCKNMRCQLDAIYITDLDYEGLHCDMQESIKEGGLK